MSVPVGAGNDREPLTRTRVLLPPGFCLNCGHHEDGHTIKNAHSPGRPGCEYEVSDYGDTDCQCSGLKLCAACEGDPEAHDLHVCGRPS